MLVAEGYNVDKLRAGKKITFTDKRFSKAILKCFHIALCVICEGGDAEF